MTDLNPYEEGLSLELQEAKDCIKALQKALKDQSSVSDRLAEQLATCEKYRDAYAEMERIGTQTVRDLEVRIKELTLQLLAVHGQAADALDKAVVAEAKLTECEARLSKAVEALRDIMSNDDLYPWRMAREVLAELEK